MSSKRKIKIKRQWNSTYKISADNPQQTIAEDLSRKEVLSKIEEFFDNRVDEITISTEYKLF